MFVLEGQVLVQTIWPVNATPPVPNARLDGALEFDDETELFIAHLTDPSRELLVGIASGTASSSRDSFGEIRSSSGSVSMPKRSWQSGKYLDPARGRSGPRQSPDRGPAGRSR